MDHFIIVYNTYC